MGPAISKSQVKNTGLPTPHRTPVSRAASWQRGGFLIAGETALNFSVKEWRTGKGYGDGEEGKKAKLLEGRKVKAEEPST